jgi:hypothetical protein
MTPYSLTLTAKNFNNTWNGSNNTNINITPDNIGALAIDGTAQYAARLSTSLSPHNRDENKAGYRLIGTYSIGTWTNIRDVWAISSRHTGTGIISFAFGCNAGEVSTANTYCTINYKGVTGTNGAVLSTQEPFVAYFNNTEKKLYLFWYYNDYNSTYITRLVSSGGGWALENGVDMDSISTSVYGTKISQITLS